VTGLELPVKVLKAADNVSLVSPQL